MPVYLYRCRACQVLGEKFQHHTDDPLSDCPECGRPMLRRVYSLNFTSVTHEHFNHTVGKMISDRKQFERELKLASDKATERTGSQVNYVSVDMNDREGLRVTDEGMDSTLRRQTETGRRDASTACTATPNAKWAVATTGGAKRIGWSTTAAGRTPATRGCRRRPRRRFTPSSPPWLVG